MSSAITGLTNPESCAHDGHMTTIASRSTAAQFEARRNLARAILAAASDAYADAQRAFEAAMDAIDGDHYSELAAGRLTPQGKA